eukprot:g8779.t1
MPGGLASWLGDDECAKAKLPKRPRLPSRAAAAPVIDVDATSPGTTAAGGGKTNRLRAPAGKGAWDPFSSKGKREDASQDAFALMRKGAAAAKPPAASTASASSPPAWREGSRPPASSWDPFGPPCADGKENRGNAFSKLLAAPASQQHGPHGKSSFGGSVKKTKLNNGSGGGGGSSEADAVTRFCECPVCGKRVIIELCSKHLDTECSGLKIDETPPEPPRDGPGTAESISSATTPSASLAPVVSKKSSPLERPAISAPTLGSPVCGGGEGNTSDTDDPAASPPKPVVAALRTIDNPGRPCETPGCGASAEAEASDQGAARDPLTSAAATAATKSTASRRKASSGAPPPLRSGRKGAAGATAAAEEEKAMTKCPVCGQSVQADLCSWHLDHECAGVCPAPAAAASSVCDGKSTGGDSSRSKREAGGEEGAAGNEAKGGLNALAAELTCPICLCVFEDVHSLPCSHRFCRECIMGCFKSSKRQECPLCKIPAWKRDLTRDVSLQNIILAYRRMAA